MFKLEFSTDNAAFEDDPAGEVADILVDIRSKVMSGRKAGRIMDSNGNKVGSWEMNDE